jgi:hypothetical protein
LVSPYEPKNIYNADKTGLFSGALPIKSLVVKGENCTRDKMSKERLSVIFFFFIIPFLFAICNNTFSK